MQRTGLAFVMSAVLATPAAAQPSVAATVNPGVTSFKGEPGASGTVNASGEFEHLFKGERLRVVYEIDIGDFSTAGDWRFVSQAAGASYHIKFDEKAKNSLYVGGDGYLRRNGDSWGAADFNGAGAFANFELRPGRGTVRTGYRFDVRRFPDSPALNQMQHAGFGSVLVSFETKTTLIGEISVGAKHYEAVSSRTEVLAAHADGDAAARAGAGMQGRGTGSRGMADATLVPVIVPGSPGSNAQHVTVFARIAQSLAARTGLSVEFSRRQVFGQVSPALIATPAMFIDDGVYDDLFASDATRGGITLKSIVARDIELMGRFGWNDKRYGATHAFDDDGLVMPDVFRHDRVRTAQAVVTCPLFPGRTGKLGLDLITGYEYTDHASTSALYRYTAHTVRMGFAVTF